MCYDAEVFPNFCSFIFKNIYTKEYHKFLIFSDRQNPKHNLNQIGDLIAFVENRCDWLIGYNNESYDDVLLMYIIINQKRLRVAEPEQVTAELYQLSVNLINASREHRTAAEVYMIRKHRKPFKYLDLILQYNTNERTSLKQIAIGLKWPILEDLPFKPSHILQFDEIPRVEHYNRNDVDITEKLMEHLTEKINLRIQYTKKFGVDIINSCNSEIGKLVIANYYEKETGIKYKDFSVLRTRYDKLPLSDCISPRIYFETPEYQRVLQRTRDSVINPNIKEKASKRKQKQFEQIVRSKYLTHTMGLGGLHSNGPAEILEDDHRYAYIDLDVASYYPWIIILEKLFPKHLGPIFTQIYRKYIVEERMRIKKEDPILAYILKIAANATFGLTKSEYSWLYDPRLTTYICVSGQLFLFMLMESLEKHSNCIVVYSNTDGLTVRVPRNEISLFYQICDRWQRYTGFELEFVKYRRMILRDVNNFMMFSYSDDPEKYIKGKGAYLYKKDEFKGYKFPIVAKAVQAYFEKGIPVKETIIMEPSIYEFMAAEKTSIEKFDVLFYEATDKRMLRPTTLQKTNRWVVTFENAGEGKLIKRAKDPVINDDGTIKTDSYGNPVHERTEMQKGFYVTPLNNVDESASIADYSINYDFYINEALSMINLTRPLNKETHLRVEYKQQLLFA